MRSRRQERAVPQPGEWLEVTYPVCNKIGVPVETRTRTFQVIEVRDLTKHPLSPETYLRNELARRSRYLITVWDDDEQEIRKVYDGSLDTTEPEVSKLRIDCEGEAVYRIGRGHRDRRIAVDVLRALKEEDYFKDITIRPEN